VITPSLSLEKNTFVVGLGRLYVEIGAPSIVGGSTSCLFESLRFLFFKRPAGMFYFSTEVGLAAPYLLFSLSRSSFSRSPFSPELDKTPPRVGFSRAGKE
jgi:hypothetical protein